MTRLRRYLEYRGLKVTYVQNFTDIDDKMIKRANSEGITIGQLADTLHRRIFHRCRRPEHPPGDLPSAGDRKHADDHQLIETLIDKGFAYETDDGVYFDVQKMPDYGKLSHHNLEDLESGASDRVSLDGEQAEQPGFCPLEKEKGRRTLLAKPLG